MPDSLSGLNTGSTIPALDVVPPPPRMPESMLRRFPELAEYDASMKKWAAELNIRLTRGVPITS